MTMLPQTHRPRNSTAVRARLGAVLGSLLLTIGSTALADGPPNEITVSVRAVHASQPASKDGTEREVDSDLHDLRAKFDQLPFHAFRLLSEQKEVVPFKKKQTFRLPNSQTLTVRPLAIENNKVSLWLKWQEKGGEDILDTRMHFGCGESMLTGVDSEAPDSGVILAITVLRHGEHGTPE